MIKSFFSRHCGHGHKQHNDARIRKNEQAVWQRRFWEHFIRDEKDVVSHVEYVHYNQVKHGLVQAPNDGPYSSFHRYADKGIYDRQWGAHGTVQFDAAIGRE